MKKPITLARPGRFNIELATEVLSYLEADPGRHKQYRGDYCVLGWASKLSGGGADRENTNGWRLDDARKALRIESREATRMWRTKRRKQARWLLQNWIDQARAAQARRIEWKIVDPRLPNTAIDRAARVVRDLERV